MRTKEFIRFIIIFTILYIIFFLIYDFFVKKNDKRRLVRLAKKAIKMDDYLKFCSFYAIEGTASLKTILKIYLNYVDNRNCTLSLAASNYDLSNFEFSTIIIYLEYLKLISSRIVSINNNCVKMTTYSEQNLIQTYSKYFDEKKDYNFIIITLVLLISLIILFIEKEGKIYGKIVIISMLVSTIFIYNELKKHYKNTEIFTLLISVTIGTPIIAILISFILKIISKGKVDTGLNSFAALLGVIIISYIYSKKNKNKPRKNN